MQTGGQMMLFQEDFNNQIVEESQIREKIIGHFSQCDTWTSLTTAEAVFFSKARCNLQAWRNCQSSPGVRKKGHLAVDRNPEFSKKTKIATSFMTGGHGQTASVKWVK